MSSIKKPAKDSIVCVNMEWGDLENPDFMRLTDYSSPQYFGGKRYVSVPNMGISLPPYTGLFSEQPLKITLPLDAHPILNVMAGGDPFPVVRISMVEILKAKQRDTTYNILYEGEASASVKNPSGKVNLVRLEFVTEKSKLDAAMGIPMNPECWAPFLGKGCFVQFPPAPVQAVVTAINGTTATLSVALTADLHAGYTRGIIEREGLRISIRDWPRDTDPNIVVLTRSVPQRWLNAVVTLHQGCTGTRGACAAYNNTNNFGGVGIAVPEIQPIVEST